jgi:hypothetical protein
MNNREYTAFAELIRCLSRQRLGEGGSIRGCLNSRQSVNRAAVLFLAIVNQAGFSLSFGPFFQL